MSFLNFVKSLPFLVLRLKKKYTFLSVVTENFSNHGGGSGMLDERHRPLYDIRLNFTYGTKNFPKHLKLNRQDEVPMF